MKQSEMRAFGRRPSGVHAMIQVRGRGRFACVVENFSELGALLLTDSGDLLPRRFLLKIDTDGFEMGCEVIQRQDNAVGVRFINPNLVNSADPVWSIDDIMSGEVARQMQEVCNTMKTKSERTSEEV